MSIAEPALVEALKALAHPLRWRILAALAAGERNVGEIEQATGIGQPALSQQLGVLRKAGLVVTRKDAKLVFYALASTAIGEVTGALSGLAPGGQTAAITPAPQRITAPGVANFARLS
ncbi:ArsR/SmtB family transcription factor [Porphyrobacter sp. AAP82]|uniref:ArsR/SmtB family transcription factor n=1 Tax=Porphyrobacter sp. AAP82 TaxID=1248917 RepID=UPI0002E42363|nr:metalloregulator ArsR/SmtB family transcription factor [Porphyrobacter sp. AAP82]